MNKSVTIVICRSARRWFRGVEGLESYPNLVLLKNPRRPYLTPNDRVLDFACGTGLVTLPVAQMAAEVCAIDISDEMVRHLKEKIAEQRVGNVSVSCMDLFDESLRPDSFDAVVACNVLLYLENRAEGRAYFADFKARATGDLLLSGYSGQKIPANFRKRDFYALLNRLGIEKKTPHATRHTYASWARKSGIAPEALQKILGHASYTTTASIYVHADAEQLIAAVEAAGNC